MSILYQSAEYFASFIEAFILLSAYSIAFEKRIIGSKNLALRLIFGIFITVLTTCLNNFSLFSYITIAIWTLAVAALSLLLYKVDFVAALSLATAYTVVLTAYEFFAISVLELLFHEQGITLEVMTQIGMVRFLFLLHAKGVLIVAFLLLRKRKYTYDLSWKQNLPLIAFEWFCFFCTQFLITAVVSGDLAEIKKSVLVAWLFVFLLLVCFVAILRMWGKITSANFEKKMIIGKMDLLEADNRSLEKAYNEVAKITHDFNNQLSLIASLVSREEYSELQNYLTEVQGGLSLVSNYTYTGIELIDAVISSKAGAAREKNIVFDVNASYPVEFIENKSDVCIALVNLLDNAIEACDQISSDAKRYISLSISGINSMLFVKVENTVANNDLDFDVNGHLKTRKTDFRRHGYGMKIIHSIAEKYGGSFKASCENGVFIAIMMLSDCNLRTK